MDREHYQHVALEGATAAVLSSEARPESGAVMPAVVAGTATTPMVWLAFAVVAVPFAVAVGRLLAAPGAHVYLPDDLALIDLHTRRALEWRQQLGVFDRNNWNHPGPTYFYLLSVTYRVFGSGARSLFAGATLLNGAAALLSVEVVRRRSTPARTLWAAIWIGVLASLLATVSAGSTTYSEGALGALVSPWNPMVVIFPLLLLVLLCAAAIDRSSLSLLAGVVVGSFVIQTDISALPLVAAVLVGAAAVWASTALRGRRPESRDLPSGRRLSRTWTAVGVAALVLMWLPPLVQQFTNHPGNLTLIYRFFTSGHSGQSLEASLWSVVSAFGVAVVGPSETMNSLLGGTPIHLGAALTATVLTGVSAGMALVVGVHHRYRFAAGLGGLTLAGCLATVFAVSHVVGFVFGYLVIWAVVLPVCAVVAVGLVPVPLRALSTPGSRASTVRVAHTALIVVALAAAAILTVRVVNLPSLGAASDPSVGRLTSLVVPVLDHPGPVFVGDAGAGTRDTRLVDTERFIGLVNQLDLRGYRPTVNQLWRVQFGPGYLASGRERQAIELSTWVPSSVGQPGYVGRAGDMAVFVTRPTGAVHRPTH